MNQKHEERDPEKLRQSNRDVMVKIAKLAFKQLIKGNVMFYEEDLIESGIDVSETSGCSWICPEILQEESVLHLRKVYSFIHLSFQEFLAAFYILHSYLTRNMEDMDCFLDERNKVKLSRSKISLFLLLKLVVSKTLHTESGLLDLFVRFLLAIAQEYNQILLKDLLPRTEYSSSTIRDFLRHIKSLMTGYYCISDNKSMSLFFCLLEMNDQSLYTDVEKLVKSGERSKNRQSQAVFSAVGYMLQTSGDVLDEFELMKYDVLDDDRKRLLPAVVNSRKALLAGCCFSDQQCPSLASALQSANSQLRELDLSNNDLQVSGVKLISAGLKSSHCQLNVLRLAGCQLSDQSCERLSSALQSSNSPLRELDLSNNDLQDSGVKRLSAGLKSSHCQLNILRLALCNLTGQSCESLASALHTANSQLRELDLSNNDLQDSGVKLISAGLKSPQCQLNVLRLSGCMVTEEGCGFLSSALTSNPSHLRELDLSYNHPGDSGVKLLSEQLEDPNYTLDRLNLENGGEFRITAGLHKYFHFLTLDPNTANTNLALSEGNRKATYVEESQPYPDHPERFDKRPHVLSREALPGRCYWETEWTGQADIAITYAGIGRKGKDADCVFGFNDNSWCLICSDDTFGLWYGYKHIDTRVFAGSCKRVGVYADESAGSVSFYSVSDTHTLTHIYTFTSTFTEPLYAGFGFMVHDLNSTVTLSPMNKPVSNNTEVTQ
ncbi:uncharacterized protein isoform X1 [Danio rerio]|uniref:Uncharacterized protein isoform X1 n=1 Tax=Danio rerio TaxID=7955 RepID=A0AC58JDA9_DANRE